MENTEQKNSAGLFVFMRKVLLFFFCVKNAFFGYNHE
ncbi:hypothetical protein LSPH24S_00056 [Lysinibacillus sphaericus]